MSQELKVPVTEPTKPTAPNNSEKYKALQKHVQAIDTELQECKRLVVGATPQDDITELLQRINELEDEYETQRKKLAIVSRMVAKADYHTKTRSSQVLNPSKKNISSTKRGPKHRTGASKKSSMSLLEED